MNRDRSRQLFSILTLLALTMTFVGGRALAQQAVAIVGGTLIDGRGGEPLRDSAVVITGDRITAVGPAARVSIPSAARVIRADGKTVLPGLIDSHMHIGGSGGGSAVPEEFTPQAAANNFKSYLLFGVTSVFDISGNPFIDQQKAALAAGQLLGPRLFGVKYGITAPDSHPMLLLKEYRILELLGPVYPNVDTVEKARAAVRKAAADKTDGVKIFHTRAEWPGTSRYDSDKDKFKPEVLKALVDEAHANRLRVFVHAAFPSEAKEALLAGVDALAHSISMSETGADEVFKLMAQRNAYYSPTLAAIEAYYALNLDPFLLERPYIKGKVWAPILKSITMPNSVVRARMGIPGLAEDARRSLEISMANLKRAVKAGVKISMGTDAGNSMTLHGATVPREMKLMNDAGMTPMQVLVAATKNAADNIGQGERLGTVEAGKLADIIIVNGDPLRDIYEIANVETVLKGGAVIETRTIKFD